MPRKRGSIEAVQTPEAKRACIPGLTPAEIVAMAVPEPTRGTHDYTPQAFWRPPPNPKTLAVKLAGSGLRKVLQNIKALFKKKGSVYFCDPVDPVELGIPDYYDIVNRPMCLALIQTQIEAGYYDRAASSVPPHRLAAEDVELVFKNAMAYNPEGSEVHTLASKFLLEWQEMQEKLESEVAADDSKEAAAAAKKAAKKAALADGGGRSTPTKADSPADHSAGVGGPRPRSRASMGGAVAAVGGETMHKKWGCFCGLRSSGDGTGDVEVGGHLLPQRRMNYFLLVDSAGAPASVEEGARLFGTLLRPGFEECDGSVSERESKWFSIVVRECYMEYNSDEKSNAYTLWLRGDRAWYKLDRPVPCYRDALRHSENRMRLGDVLKSQLLKTPKVSWERLLQVVAGRCISFLAAPSLKQRLREKMTRSLILAEAPYLACCIDDVAEVLHKGQSAQARTRRQTFANSLTERLRYAAAGAAADKTWYRLCASHGIACALDAEAGGGDESIVADEDEIARGDDGPLGLLGSLPTGEAVQVVSAVEEACLGALFEDMRRQRVALMGSAKEEEEIRGVLNAMIDNIVKLNAMPRGTVVCKGKDTRIVDYCRTVVDFLDCCGGGLFLASDTRTDLLPPQPLTLIKGVASPVPSDAIVRLHLKLLALLRNEYRPDTKKVVPSEALVWPELLRRAMEAELLERASTMAMERKENGEALVIPFSLEEEEEVVDGEAEDEDTDAVDRRHARAYLRCYAEYFADELEIIEHLKAAEYDSLPELLRWRALDWLCSSVCEAEDGAVRQELERRLTGHRLLERLQDSMRPANLAQLSPDLRAVATGLNAALEEDFASYGWFSAPVDAEKLGLTDYHQVVKTPMDLGTVLQNLVKVPSTAGEPRVYESAAAALRDVRQVWLNARAYNGKHSPVTKAAEHLEALFDATYSAARDGVEDGGHAPRASAGVNAPRDAEAKRRAEERARAAAVRSEPVGRDRLHRSYYWDGGALLVEASKDVAVSGDNAALSCEDGALPCILSHRDVPKLVEFLDDSEPDRELKKWLEENGELFERKAIPRDDAVGSWLPPQAEGFPAADENAGKDTGNKLSPSNEVQTCPEYVASGLRQLVQELRGAVMSQPTSLGVRRELHALTSYIHSHATTDTGGRGGWSSLRERVLALEAALVEVGALGLGWSAGRGREWKRSSVVAQTAAALGLLMEELADASQEQAAALKARELSRSVWFKTHTRKGRFVCPVPLQEVTYLRQGHLQQSNSYGMHPWDEEVRPSARHGGGEMCQVESVRFFNGDLTGSGGGSAPFAVVQLRSLQIAAGEGENLDAAGEVAAAGGVGGRVAAQALPGGHDDGDTRSEGQVFYVTLHCGIVALPEMLIDSSVFSRSLLPCKAGEVVRMWFADNSGVGGSFYSGTVVSQSLPENGDPWDSVTVRWEDGEEMQVSPWELKRAGDKDETLSAAASAADTSVRTRARFIGLECDVVQGQSASNGTA